nr:putative capsid [Marmot picobirnavirus]
MDDKEKKDPKDNKICKNPKDDKRVGGKGKGRKDNKRGSDKKGYPPQDPAWYALSEKILKDVASYPFSKPVGATIASGIDVTPSQQTPSVLPGILTFKYQHSVGNGKEGSSALQTAAQEFYAYVRQANSGAKNYEAPDLMVYFLSATGIYDLVAKCKRAYRLLKRFSNYNLYLGKPLIEQLGFNYDDIVSNQADFRRIVNTAIHRINSSLHLPKGMTWFDRAAFLASNVFADRPGDKFQMYLFDTDFLWMWTGTEATGSAIVNFEIPGMISVDTLSTLFNTLIDALITDEDVQIMSGDILKAYGDDNTLKIPELEEDEELEIVYHPEMLLQIHNMQSNFSTGDGTAWLNNVAAADTYVEGNLPVFQRNGRIYSIPALKTADAFYTSFLLDVPVDSPTPGDVMEGTRLKQFISQKSSDRIQMSDGRTYNAITCGSEIITTVSSITLSSNNGILTTRTDDIDFVSDSTNTSGITTLFWYQSLGTGFEWRPLYYAAEKSDTPSTLPGYYNGDISNFTLLSYNNLDDLHYAAIFGLLRVPTYTVSK